MNRLDVTASPAGIGDAATVAALLREAFREYEPLYSPAAYAATTPTSEQLRARWAEGPVWITWLADHAVGTVAAVPTGEGLFVRSMAVRPAACGRGVGRLLMARVEDFARQRGIRRLYLSTTPFLHRAIRLYERLGFVRTNAGPDELHGTPLVTLEKVLAAEAAAAR